MRTRNLIATFMLGVVHILTSQSFAQETNSQLEELQTKIVRLESTITRVKQRYLLADSTLVLPVSENEIELQKLKLELYNLENRAEKGAVVSTDNTSIPFLYIKKSELDALPDSKRNYIIEHPSLYRVIENQ